MLLVTGITGHTGRYFLQELIKNTYKELIRCVVRYTSNTSMIDDSGLNIEKVAGDLNDEKFINTIMHGVDTILHIYNIHHSPLIVKAAIENNVKRVILVHTTGIFSNFKDASKTYKEIENEISNLTSSYQYRTAVTILRPTMIYGDLCDKNISKFIKIIDKFRVIPVVNGGNSFIQPVNARDLGRAYYSVIMSPEKTASKDYILSGDKPVKIIEVFQLISFKLNKKTIFINIPLWLGVLTAKAGKIISMGKVDFIEKVQRMGEDRSFPHTQAEKDFNFNPMSFEEGIDIEVKQYLSR